MNDLKKTKNYSDVEKVVENHLKKANVEFLGKELEAVQSGLAVLKYSSKLWLPVSKGGEGGISSLISTPLAGKDSQQLVINWWKVAVCDVVGAIGDGIMGGWAGASVGAGVASACSAINQY